MSRAETAAATPSDPAGASPAAPTPPVDRIGILAGGGQLPLLIADSVVARGGRVHIVAIDGEADQDVNRFPHTWVNWGQIERMVTTLRSEGGGEMVIAGSVRRPDLWKLRPDTGLFKSLPQLVGLLAGGDDSVLSRVVRFFESKGFTVRGAHDVAPGLVAGAGPIGAAALLGPDRADAEIGFAVRRALGPLDAGQAVVVARGRVLAIEGAEGTDAMLQRVADQRSANADASTSAAGVLTKGPKPGQELRVDMPAIGPRTVELAAAAGLAGIAVEAGSVLVLGREAAVQAADAKRVAIEGLASRTNSESLAGSAEAHDGRLVGRLRPAQRDRVDMAKGLAALQRLAGFETGSAVVVARAYVLAFAASETVSAMLDRVRALRQWGMRGNRRLGVLVCRADALGDGAALQQMCEQAALQGLAGIAMAGTPEALAPCEDAARIADEHGLFLVTCRWK
jgi:UDP-2,3-diacylglucosamine hydrolase